MRGKKFAILTVTVVCLSLATALAVPLAGPVQASPMEILHLTCTLSSGNWTQRSFDLEPGDEIIQFTRPNLVVGNNSESILATGTNATGTVSGDLSGSIGANYIQLMASWDGLPSSSGYFVTKFQFDDGHGNNFRGLSVMDYDWSVTSDSRWGYVIAGGAGTFSGQALIGTVSYSNDGPMYMTLRRYYGPEVSGPYPTEGTGTNAVPNIRVLNTGDELHLVQFTRDDIVIPGDATALYQEGGSFSGSLTGGLAGTITQTYNNIIIPGTNPPGQGLSISKFTTSNASGTLSGVAVYDSLGVTGGNATVQGLLFALKENATGVYAGKDYFMTAACTGTQETVTINGNLYILAASTEFTPISGITRQVNGDILPGVSITLDGMGPVVSDQAGQFQIMATSTGSKNLLAHKDGFRDQTRNINIAGLGQGYAVTCNFQRQYGLIPNAPNGWYVSKCVNLWLFPRNPDIDLDSWTVAKVVNAWLFPVYPTPAPYKVGALFAVTGFNSLLGQTQYETVEMLERQINDAGGINGHPLDVIMYDTESNPTRCATLANSLIGEGVVAIIGPTSTGESMSIKSIVNQGNVTLVSCGAGSVLVEPAGNNTWIFNTPPFDYIAIERVYTYLQEQGITKIAILTDTAGFGASGRNWLKNQGLLSEYGLTIVPGGDQTYSTYDVDMQTQLTVIKGTEAQALVCWGMSPGPATVAQDMKTLSMTIPLICSQGIAFKSFIDAAGTAANGVIFPSGKLLIAEELPETDPQKAILEKYKADFEAEYGVGTATNFGGHAYDALMMVAEALQNVGPDKAMIRYYIENNIVNWPGIDGVYNMSPQDHNGLPKDPKEAMVLVEIVDGEWTWLQ